MMEHLTRLQIEGFQKRNLAPAEAEAISLHLQECDACRDLVMKSSAFQKGFDSLRSQVQSQDHPAFEELADFVNGIRDHEWIQEHLQDCCNCAMQVDDMREARKELAAPLQLRRSPVPSAYRSLLIAASILLALLAAAWFFRIALQKPVPKIVHPLPPRNENHFVYKDGNYRIETDSSGRIESLPGVSREDLAMLQGTIQSGTLPKPPDTKTLNPEGSVLMSEHQESLPFHVLYPVGLIVLPQRPEFRWEPLPGAKAYQVVVTDRNLNVVAMSPQIHDAHWSPQKDLERGVIYSWQVIAKTSEREIRSPSSPAPEALFQVLSRERSDRIESAIRRNAPELVLVALMNEAGLTAEASDHLRRLQLQNPGNPFLQRLHLSSSK